MLGKRLAQGFVSCKDHPDALKEPIFASSLWELGGLFPSKAEVQLPPDRQLVQGFSLALPKSPLRTGQQPGSWEKAAALRREWRHSSWSSLELECRNRPKSPPGTSCLPSASNFSLSLCAGQHTGSPGKLSLQPLLLGEATQSLYSRFQPQRQGRLLCRDWSVGVPRECGRVIISNAIVGCEPPTGSRVDCPKADDVPWEFWHLARVL